MGPLEADAGFVPSLPEDAPKEHGMRDGDLPTGSGSKSTHTAGELAMASPRLIPIPGPPTNSGGPVFPPIMENSGETSVSCDQQRVPSQTPE